MQLQDKLFEYHISLGSENKKKINKVQKFLNGLGQKLLMDHIEELLKESCNTKSKTSYLRKKSINISLLICGEAKIRQINKNFRGKNKATDVLSFPQFENREGLNEALELSHFPVLLGDISINFEEVLRVARKEKIPFELHFLRLLVHGILHLLGFDHEKSIEDEREMFYLESRILSHLAFKFI